MRQQLSKAIALAAIVTLGVAAAPASAATATACPSAAATPTQAGLEQVERTVLCLVNRERTSRGLGRLKSSRKLATAAEGHSKDMVRRAYFDHVSPGGGTLLERIKETGWLNGGRSYTFAENIAWGSSQLAAPVHIVQRWMQSAGHRRNILSRRYDELGIGIALGTPRGHADGATYTTDFGAKS